MSLSWKLSLTVLLLVTAPTLCPADAMNEPGGGANTIVIPDVPSYIWYNGCGPTAGGMIIGYWDAHGYSNLIVGSNDWNTNQQGIEDMIASPGHIRDFVPTPDRVETLDDPYHTLDSVADFNYCSRFPDQYGWSYYTYQDDGLRNYAIIRGYVDSTAYNISYSTLWNAFVTAIDDDHPVEFLVDTDANGQTDHFVTAIGYYDAPGSEMYACYDTWSHNIRWYSYAPVGVGISWGVHGGTFFQPLPEPTLLVPVGLALVILRRRSPQHL